MTTTREQDLQGKVALVTGSTTGIGLAAAKELLSRGAHVTFNGLFTGIRDQEGTVIKTPEEQRAEFMAEFDALKERYKGRDIRFAEINVAKSIEAKVLVEAATSGHGKLDIIVNSAGIHPVGVQKSFFDVDLAAAQRLMDVNYFGVLNVSHAAGEFVKNTVDGVTILNLSSVHGHVSPAGRSIYAGGKHGLEGFMKAANADMQAFHPNNRMVNICPAFVKTELAVAPVRDLAKGYAAKHNVSYDDAYKVAEAWRLQLQEGKWIEEDEVAKAIGDVAAGKREVPQGQSVILDNGYTRRVDRDTGVIVFKPINEIGQMMAEGRDPGKPSWLDRKITEAEALRTGGTVPGDL